MYMYANVPKKSISGKLFASGAGNCINVKSQGHEFIDFAIILAIDFSTHHYSTEAKIKKLIYVIF